MAKAKDPDPKKNKFESLADAVGQCFGGVALFRMFVKFLALVVLIISVKLLVKR